MMKTWFNEEDVINMYILVKGNNVGINEFLSEAKKISTKTKSGAYIFKKEQKLFELFKRKLGFELKIKNIHCWESLVQLYS